MILPPTPINTRLIEVVDYDTAWAADFERWHGRIWPLIQHVAVSLEHVGSTAVPGLAAKPVVDIDIIVPTRAELPAVIEAVSTLGYLHKGDLGIADREAFRAPAGEPRHHLYACPRDAFALQNHLTLRDHLRRYPEDAAAYGALKKDLAARFPYDIDSYIAGKTAFVLGVLARYGLQPF